MKCTSVFMATICIISEFSKHTSSSGSITHEVINLIIYVRGFSGALDSLFSGHFRTLGRLGPSMGKCFHLVEIASATLDVS